MHCGAITQAGGTCKRSPAKGKRYCNLHAAAPATDALLSEHNRIFKRGYSRATRAEWARQLITVWKLRASQTSKKEKPSSA